MQKIIIWKLNQKENTGLQKKIVTVNITWWQEMCGGCIFGLQSQIHCTTGL